MNSNAPRTKAEQREATTAALIAAARDAVRRARLRRRRHRGDRSARRRHARRAYHHFRGGKEDLFRAVLVQISAETTERVMARGERDRGSVGGARRRHRRVPRRVHEPRGPADHAHRRPRRCSAGTCGARPTAITRSGCSRRCCSAAMDAGADGPPASAGARAGADRSARRGGDGRRARRGPGRRAAGDGPDRAPAARGSTRTDALGARPVLLRRTTRRAADRAAVARLDLGSARAGLG